MKTMLRLANKKGFTLMELVVVIAIVAIFTGIAVPVFLGAGGPVDRGKNYAKSFYYDVQDLMMEYSLSDYFAVVNDTTGDKVDFISDGHRVIANTRFFLLVAVRYIDTMNTADEMQIRLYSTSNVAGTNDTTLLQTFKEGTFVAPGSLVYDGIDLNGNGSAGDEFHDGKSIKKSLFNRCTPVKNTDDGWMYALVDSKFRVVRTFWSNTDLETLNASGTQFVVTERSHYIDVNIVASYPDNDTYYDTVRNKCLFDVYDPESVLG